MTVQEMITLLLESCGDEKPENVETHIWSQARGWPNYTLNEKPVITYHTDTPEQKILSIELDRVGE
jgi:hypothetical protein